MRPVQLLILSLAAACAPASAQTSQPASAAAPAATAEQEAIMDRIERDVRLPEGARPLAAYDRQYAWFEEASGHRAVVGKYFHVGGPPGRRWLEGLDFPMIEDGGCDIVTLIYIVAEQRFQSVYCNGVA